VVSQLDSGGLLSIRQIVGIITQVGESHLQRPTAIPRVQPVVQQRFNALTENEKLKLIAKDLTKDYPRSPRETLAGYVIAARMLDKCRAVIAGTAGEYRFSLR